MTNEDIKPGTNLRDNPFQQNDPFLEVVNTERARANHEQGGKVQFVFTPSAPTFANFNGTVAFNVINQSYPIVGYPYFGVELFMSIQVIIPDDTVVNRVRVKLYVAPTWYSDDGVPVDEFRYVKDIVLFNATTLQTVLFYDVTAGGESAGQYFTGSSTDLSVPLPNDITNSVFGSSTLNVGVTNPQTITSGGVPIVPPIPDIQTFESTAAGEDYLATIITEGSENIFKFYSTPGTIGYFSPCWAEIIVDGYTRNR